MTLLVRHTDVLGGVVGGFLPDAPFLGWRVYDVVDTHVDPAGVELPAITIRKVSGPPADTIAQVQTRASSLFVAHSWPYPSPYPVGRYPGLQWHFLDPSTLALVAGPLLPIGNARLNNFLDSVKRTTPITEHIVQWFEHTLPTGPYIGVLTARVPSEDYPLFVSGPPVEIVEDLLTRKGEPYDAATATAAITAMNPKLHHLMPVTSVDLTPQEQIDQLSEGYGFALRASAVTGEAQFIYWREKLGDVSSLPVIDDLSVRSDGGPTFDHAENSRINRVRIAGLALSKWQPGTVMVPQITQRKLFGIPYGPPKVRFVAKPATLDTDKPASGLMITSVEVVFDYSSDGVTADADLYGEQEVTIELGGMPALDNNVVGGSTALSLQQWGEGVARLIFDKHARGGMVLSAPVLRDSDGDTNGLLGEAIAVDLSHAVNPQLGQSPTSQRGGLRPFRVIERTPQPTVGPFLTLVDEGTGVQYATAPTLVVRMGVTQPTGNVQYRLEISPAATFTADRAWLEFQVLAFATGETVVLSNPGIRYTILDSSLWTDDPQSVYLGDFPANHQLYFRARAFLVGGSASDWSAWTSIGGPNTGPGTTLSNLVIDQITDEGARLTWSYDESPQVGTVRVQYRDVTTIVGPWTNATGSPFAAGTQTTTLTGLTLGHNYEVRVVLLNPGEYGDVLLGSFTTTGGKISSLVISSVTASSAKLLWTNTNATEQVVVEYRVVGDPFWSTHAYLNPTTNRTTITGLQQLTNYEVQVSIAATDGAGGPPLTDSFTTLAVSVQLEFPLMGGPFWDWDPATALDYNGRFGVRLNANPNNIGIAHDIIVLLAVETAIGSGTPGTFIEQSPIAATPGVDLWFVDDAPNDGKKRYMKALSRAVGYTDSIETDVETATPWAATGPQPPAGGGIPNTYTITATAVGTGASVTGFFAVPDGAEMFRVESPNGKEIRIRLYTDSTVLASDSARASNDSNWPIGILYDGEILSSDSFLIDLPPPQRVRFLLSAHENRVVWYRLTNLEAGTEDLECRIYYFAAPTGGTGTLA